jgi:cytochrome P450
MFAVPDSSISTISHALHRRRRAMFSNHFSAAAVHKLEPLLKEKIDILFARLGEAKKTGEPVPMWHAFSALTADIITAYSFPEGYDHLGAADFAPQMHEMVNRFSLGSHLIKQCPWLLQLLRVLPENIAKKVQPDLALVIEIQEGLVRQVRKVIEARTVSKMTSVEGQIFDSMLDAEVPDSEKTVERLAMEAQLLVLAGMLTTAHTLMTIVYHVLANPEVLTRLMDELSNVSAGSIEAVPLSALEKLPYLTAVIYEGLRVGYGVPHRLQRVSPDMSLQYGKYTIPPGTPVSMSAMLQHEDPEIFPEPKKFLPERWLPIETEGQRLHGYLVPFSKGSRQCVGMNLAYGELYLTLAGLFSRFGKNMELWDTVWERDIKTSIDAFNPLPTLNSKGLQVVIKEI